MFDLGIENVKRYHEWYFEHVCDTCRPIWLVEFRDFTSVVVLYNDDHELDGEIVGNFVMEEKPLEIS